MQPVEVLLQVMLVLESTATDDTGKLSLDTALPPLMLSQRAPGLVNLVAAFARELAMFRPTRS